MGEREFLDDLSSLKRLATELLEKHGCANPQEVIDSVERGMRMSIEAGFMVEDANAAIGLETTDEESGAASIYVLISEVNKMAGYEKYELVIKENRNGEKRG